MRRKLALAAALVLLDLALAGLGIALAVQGRAAAGLALAAAALAALLAAAQALWPRLDLFGWSLIGGDRRSRDVALTFDDGPGPHTLAVLDALDNAAAHATFFLLGRAAEARPDLVREIARRGHTVALHGMTHAKLALAGPLRAGAEIDACREAIRAAGVEPAPLFRAPHGFKGPGLVRALRERGLVLVGWSRGVFDTERPGVEVIVSRAARRMRGGEILLLHDGCGTQGIDPRRDQTAGAVPEIVRRWREAGYRFVPVEALVRRSGAFRAALEEVRRDAAAAPPARRRALRLAGLAVLAACAGLALRNVDLRAVALALSRANAALLALAAAFNVLSLAAHAGRWQALVRQGAPTRFRDVFASLVAGFTAGFAISARAGDLVRAHLLARRARLPTSTVVATAAVDYLVGGAVLPPLLALLLLAGRPPPWAGRAFAIALAVVVAGGLAVWLLRPRSRHPASGAGGLGSRLRLGLVAAHDPGAVLRSASWAVGGWAAELLIALFTLAAFGLPASLPAAVLAVLASTAASFVSVSPGNAGPFELAVVLALGGLGVPRELALACALGYHLVHLVPTAVLGSVALLREARA